MWEKHKPQNLCSLTRQKRGGQKFLQYYSETLYTCQVTNQSSHGELSFHHNPHPSALLGLAPLYSRVIRSGGARMKNAAHLHTVIVVSYAR